MHVIHPPRMQGLIQKIGAGGANEIRGHISPQLYRIKGGCGGQIHAYFGINGSILPSFRGHLAQNLGHLAPAGGPWPLCPPPLDQPRRMGDKLSKMSSYNTLIKLRTKVYFLFQTLDFEVYNLMLKSPSIT